MQDGQESLDVLLFSSFILGEAVDTALLPREPAADEDNEGDDVEFRVLLASTSDMLLSSEYRYRFI